MIYKIEFHKLRDDAVVPQIQTEGSAGADLVVPDVALIRVSFQKIFLEREFGFHAL